MEGSQTLRNVDQPVCMWAILEAASTLLDEGGVTQEDMSPEELVGIFPKGTAELVTLSAGETEQQYCRVICGIGHCSTERMVTVRGHELQTANGRRTDRVGRGTVNDGDCPASLDGDSFSKKRLSALADGYLRQATERE